MDGSLESMCRGLAGLSPAWSWDGRFAAVTAAFESAQEPTLHAALGERFESRWGSTDLATAPQRVRTLAGKLGGLRGDQWLLTNAREDGALLYCAWWPWQSGTRFSLRIGVVDAPGAPDLRPWFGV